MNDIATTKTPIVEYSKTEAALTKLRERFSAVVFDVKSPKGMKEAKEARNEIRTYRLDLEKKRVEIKEPALERCRLIDSEAKRIEAALRKLEDPIAETIKAEEDRAKAEREAKIKAEQDRISNILKRLNDLKHYAGQFINADSERVAKAMELFVAPDKDDYQEYYDQAVVEWLTSKDALETLLTQRKAAEEREAIVKAEQEALAKQRAELEAKEAEIKRRQAEEDARIEAQREAIRKAEDEKNAAMERAHRAEREALEQERRLEQQRRDEEDRKLKEQQAAIARQQEELAAQKAEQERIVAEQAAHQQALEEMRANSSDEALLQIIDVCKNYRQFTFPRQAFEKIALIAEANLTAAKAA